MGYFGLVALGVSAFFVHSSLALPSPQFGISLTINLPVIIGAPAGSPPPAIPLSEVTASNTGSAALPTPTGSPKYVVLGVGFQNYTCNGATYVQNQVADGAIANLYDITSELSTSNMDTITPNALQQFQNCLSATSCQPDGTNFCELCHVTAVASVDPVAVKQAGLHFFDHPSGAQIPNFNVFKFGDFLSAKKVGNVKAPATAYAGSNGLGAVDWLYLVDNGNGRTHGVSSVYRVETAGGVAPKTCAQAGGSLSVPYAAQYWFWA